MPKSTSSNSTSTQIGPHSSGLLEFGSNPSGNINPFTTPIAPFIRPASTHSFEVSNTLAPSHTSNDAFKPLKSSALMVSHFISTASFGLSWLARTDKIGVFAPLLSSSSLRALNWSALSSPRLFTCLVVIRIGASLKRSSSFRPASVLAKAVRFRHANQRCSFGVHFKSAMARVTLMNSSASNLYRPRSSGDIPSCPSSKRCGFSNMATSSNSRMNNWLSCTNARGCGPPGVPPFGHLFNALPS